MLDDLNSRPGAGDLSGEQAWVPGGDREVPLSAKAQATLHRWLDGEATEAEAVVADAKHTELWRRVNAETARRRQMKTPPYVETRIMQSLPTGVPRVQPAVKRGVELSRGAALAIGAGLLALGALIGALLL